MHPTSLTETDYPDIDDTPSPGGPVSYFQDVPITTETLRNGQLHQRFDVVAFPKEGERLSGTVDGALYPSPPVPLTDRDTTLVQALGTGTHPEAEWLLTLQAADGAIIEDTGSTNLYPYMAHYGALGLARAAQALGNSSYSTASWRWLNWYAAHMDATGGFVNDYTGHSGAWVDSGHADSYDAYAGMFLVALWATYQADPNNAKLAALHTKIALAMTALETYTQADGLTWALPSFTVKYLEDNIEALVGARCGAALATILGDGTLAARCTATADGMARGMGAMWNHDSGTWDFAIHENGVFAHNDWSDENSQRQQVWATAWGAIASSPEGAALMAAYQTALPGWAAQTSPSYEVLPAWALRRVGQNAAANAAVATLQSNATSTDHAYPWTCALAGQLVVAALGFPPGLPSPGVHFPAGANLLPNSNFSLDSNADGIADGVGNYGSPAMSLHNLVSGGRYQEMTVTGGGNDMRWDPVAVTPGNYYCFSAYIRATDLQDNADVVIKYELVKSNGALSDVTPYGYSISTVKNAVQREYLTVLVPPDAVSFRCVIGIENATGTIQVAHPQLEIAGSPTGVPGGAPVFP